MRMDGVFKGKAVDIGAMYTTLQDLLRDKKLWVNEEKCDVYAKTSDLLLPASIEKIPAERDPDKWRYLGAPLCEQTRAAVQEGLNRMDNFQGGRITYLSLLLLYSVELNGIIWYYSL